MGAWKTLLETFSLTGEEGNTEKGKIKRKKIPEAKEVVLEIKFATKKELERETKWLSSKNDPPLTPEMVDKMFKRSGGIEGFLKKFEDFEERHARFMRENFDLEELEKQSKKTEAQIQKMHQKQKPKKEIKIIDYGDSKVKKPFFRSTLPAKNGKIILDSGHHSHIFFLDNLFKGRTVQEGDEYFPKMGMLLKLPIEQTLKELEKLRGKVPYETEKFDQDFEEMDKIHNEFSKDIENALTTPFGISRIKIRAIKPKKARITKNTIKKYYDPKTNKIKKFKKHETKNGAIYAI